ncbi:MAG TPA: hypothetical protein VGG39_36210 [Polyangiaceae bacterium]|jgi:hypothetical protein
MRSTSRFAVPGAFCFAAPFALATLAAVTACVTPKSDYDDWRNRTAPERAAGPPDAGSGGETSVADGGLDQPFTQTYAMICTSQVFLDDPSRASYFIATINYTPDPNGGGGGTMTYSDQALALTSVGPPAVPPASIANPIGDPVSESNIVVSADGKAYAAFGASVVPAADDPGQPGNDIDFNDTKLYFTISSPTQLCANLGGDIATPLAIPNLSPTENICIYMATDGPVPSSQPAANQFNCPYTVGQYPGASDD